LEWGRRIRHSSNCPHHVHAGRGQGDHLDANYPLAKVKESVDRIEDYLYANQERFEIRNVYTYYNEEGTGQILIYLTEDDEAIRSSQEIAKEILEGLPKIAIGAQSLEWDRAGGGESLSVTLSGSSSEVRKELGKASCSIT
jgi:HAE1 family hydrophobic/amphiphilic exporter-1